MVRIGACQFGDVWMFEWVLPGDFLASPIDFIAVATNLPSRKVNKLPNIQDHIALENHLPLEFGQRRTDASQNLCGASHARITLLKRVDEFSVDMEICYGHYVAGDAGLKEYSLCVLRALRCNIRAQYFFDMIQLRPWVTRSDF